MIPPRGGFTLRSSHPLNAYFNFSGEAIARPLWCYLDLTAHVVWLGDALKRTICEHMREESRYLQQHAQARAAIKEIIEMPNIQIDRVIRSAQANQGKLSNALAKELPALTEAGRWEAIVEAIGVAFDDTLLEPSDGRAADRAA